MSRPRWSSFDMPPAYQVIRVTERRPKSWGQAEDLTRVLSREWTVETDSPKVGPVRVMTAWGAHCGVAIGTHYKVGTAPDPLAVPPVAGDPWFEEDTGAFARSINCEQVDESGFQWLVRVEYGPQSYDVEKKEDPTEEEPSVEWDFDPHEEIADLDRNGDPIVNTAGDPFDPAVMRDRTDPVLTVTVNVADPFDFETAYNFCDSVNDDVFFGAPARYVKIKSIKARRQRAASGVRYWQITYVFAFNRKTWDKVILNQGRREKISGQRRLILIDNAPASDPVPLDATGQKLAPGDAPVFLTFELYTPQDFSAFEIAGS
jgi:hypothetical protein